MGTKIVDGGPMRTKSIALHGGRVCWTVGPVREEPRSGEAIGRAMNGKGLSEVRLWGTEEKRSSR